MTELPNPFNALYITEEIGPEEFVHYFSPLLVSDTRQLFERGNVVLKGVQGTGKTMLLALLKPEIRIAYANAQEKFPVKDLGEELSRFVGAGINLQDSYATAFGNRPIAKDAEDQPAELAVYFGDFLNYFVVRDLLCTLGKLRGADETVGDLEIATDPTKYVDFSRRLAQDESWFGSLESVRDLASLKDALTNRIRIYRSFFNYNCDDIPGHVRASKTSAGEPISATAVALWECEIIPRDVRIFVQIDQYEELLRLEQAEQATGSRRLSERYRAVIRGMLARRDPSVSYRVGTRRYAWDERPTPGSPVVAEELRNYDVVDLDQILRREEYHSHEIDVFKRFAEDVFTRRLKLARYKLAEDQESIPEVFGKRMTAKERAMKYAAESASFLDLRDDWPLEVRESLVELAKDDPLSAKLGEAWVRQQANRFDQVLPKKGHFPWNDPEKKWWRKERNQQALLQIAAARQQRLIWNGEEDVWNLSYGHILVLLSICKYVWAAWLRSSTNIVEKEPYPLPLIQIYTQDMGIRQASKYWYEKIGEDQGGDTRKRFVEFLGVFFRTQLRDDKAMSYPGRNGFSVAVHELDGDTPVRDFLEQAAAYGFLIDKRHTPKNVGRGDSWKWYLHPVLCPHFQIPAIHTKEPQYVSASEVRSWLEHDKVQGIDPQVRQMKLFEDDGV